MKSFSPFIPKFRAVLISALLFAMMHLLMRTIKTKTFLGDFETDNQIFFVTGLTMLFIGIISDALLIAKGVSTVRNFTFWGSKNQKPNWAKPVPFFSLSLVLILMAVVKQVKIGNPLFSSIIWVGSKFLCVALGEEVFFRGFILNYLNQEFEKNWTFKGVKFGWALILSSLLFGGIHVLNTFDYFTWTGTFSWGWGLATFGSGIIFGYLVEHSGGLGFSWLLHSCRLILTIQTKI